MSQTEYCQITDEDVQNARLIEEAFAGSPYDTSFVLVEDCGVKGVGVIVRLPGGKVLPAQVANTLFQIHAYDPDFDYELWQDDSVLVTWNM